MPAAELRGIAEALHHVNQAEDRAQGSRASANSRPPSRARRPAPRRNRGGASLSASSICRATFALVPSTARPSAVLRNGLAGAIDLAFERDQSFAAGNLRVVQQRCQHRLPSVPARQTQVANGTDRPADQRERIAHDDRRERAAEDDQCRGRLPERAGSARLPAAAPAAQSPTPPERRGRSPDRCAERRTSSSRHPGLDGDGVNRPKNLCQLGFRRPVVHPRRQLAHEREILRRVHGDSQIRSTHSGGSGRRSAA